jgi:hypothetical protein
LAITRDELRDLFGIEGVELNAREVNLLDHGDYQEEAIGFADRAGGHIRGFLCRPTSQSA